jgi:hypothetical protein
VISKAKKSSKNTLFIFLRFRCKEPDWSMSELDQPTKLKVAININIGTKKTATIFLSSRKDLLGAFLLINF